MSKIPFKQLSELTIEEIDTIEYPVHIFIIDDVKYKEDFYSRQYYDENGEIQKFKAGDVFYSGLNKEQFKKYVADGNIKNEYIVAPSSQIIHMMKMIILFLGQKINMIILL